MANDVIHLVLGDTAAGVLREAMACGAVAAAEILRFRDIYCLGPLNELGTPAGAASRAAYWTQLLPDSPPPLAEFEEEEARYALVRDTAATTPLLLWVGAHSSSQLWLQRLGAVLPGQSPKVGVIAVSEAGSGRRRRRALSQFEPHAVGRLLAGQRHLGEEDLAQLAKAWERNAAVVSGLRRWTAGRISHHADDYYDGLLLTQCDRDWQPAGQVIGSALWECDEFLGDVFFAWRLRYLTQAGRLQWRGPPQRLRESEVRLPSPRN